MPKFRFKRKNVAAFMAFLMLFLTLATVISNAGTDQPQHPQKEYIGDWQGMRILAKQTNANTSIYYLELQPGYQVVMRADPREAATVESPPSMLLYSLLYTSDRITQVFEPGDADQVGLAFAEMAKFLTNRPFELVFATTERYTNELNRTYPSKDPFNTTEKEAVVYFRIANRTRIRQVNRTIILEGEDRWGLVQAGAKLELILLRLT